MLLLILHNIHFSTLRADELCLTGYNRCALQDVRILIIIMLMLKLMTTTGAGPLADVWKGCFAWFSGSCWRLCWMRRKKVKIKMLVLTHPLFVFNYLYFVSIHLATHLYTICLVFYQSFNWVLRTWLYSAKLQNVDYKSVPTFQRYC